MMSELWKLGFRGKDLESLNTVRKFLNLLHLSDLTACDGSTIDQSVYLEAAVKSQKHVFSDREPNKRRLQAVERYNWKPYVWRRKNYASSRGLCCGATPHNGLDSK